MMGHRLRRFRRPLRRLTFSMVRWGAKRLSCLNRARSRFMLRQVVVFYLASAACLCAAAPVEAQNQPVPLPYIFHDDRGSNWDVMYDGSIGDGGNDLYDGGGRPFITNRAQFQSPTQRAS